MFPGVVGTAYQRAGFDVAEALLQGVLLEESEFFGGDVAGDGQLVFGRAQVLAEGENVAAVLAQVAEDLFQFIASLAQAEH